MKRALRFLLLLALLLAVAGTGLYFYASHYYTAPGPLTEARTVVIPKGHGFRRIVATLEELQVLDKAWLYTGIIMKDSLAEKFKAGEYLFPPHITPLEITRKLISGDVVRHAVTVPEGLISRDVIALVAADPLLTGTVPQSLPEGSLLPETYDYLREESRMAVITRMQAAMQKTLKTLIPTCDKDLPIQTENEFLTLASIVEKETGIDAERAHVAGVFMNRLRMGMRLQSDPTTLYGMYHATGKWHKNITRKDLETVTEYNTYAIDGLPPGPIANPGKASLEAVCHPAKTMDLYFVATGDGGHRFSETLDEHNQNVRSYLKALRKSRNVSKP